MLLTPKIKTYLLNEKINFNNNQNYFYFLCRG
jgi:hypothetical protein